MTNKTLGELFLEELEQEAPATRKCLERIPGEMFGWKPHERSMTMGNLAHTVASIPGWITSIIEQPEIDFAKYEHVKIETTEGLLAAFDKNMEGARKALSGAKDEVFKEQFALKMNGTELFSAPKKFQVSSSINHLAHHRGQLTVYMRMKEIKVPSIYGPTADEQSWG